MVISQLLVNFIPDQATKHQHFIVSNFRKTFHLFLEYGELPALPIRQITFKYFPNCLTTLKAVYIADGIELDLPAITPICYLQ